MRIKDIIELLKNVDIDSEEEDEDVTQFIPPLQAELEMLKQRAGLTSAYDDQTGNQHGNTCPGFLDQ